MNTKNHRTNLVTFSFAALLTVSLVFGGSTVSAKNYVNWGNNYYFEVPSDWRQIERYNVEEFLRLHGKDPVSVPYDAFFCPVDAEPFWSQAYLFVTTEKSENSIDQAQALLKGMREEFDNMTKSLDSLGPITRLNSRKPQFDSKTKTITQISSLNVQGVEQIMHLAMRFHKTGITSFYYYSRADIYESLRPKFVTMVNSFSDENLEEIESNDSVQIVDVTESDSGSSAGATSSGVESTGNGDSESSDSSTRNIILMIVAALALGLFVYTARRGKSGDS